VNNRKWCSLLKRPQSLQSQSQLPYSDHLTRSPDPEQGLRNAKHRAAQLDNCYPGAAASLREGFEEMFTVARLGIDGRLAKTLTISNPIESVISVARTTNRHATRRRDGGMLYAQRSFRRIMGYKQMSSSSTPIANTPTPTSKLSVPPHRVHRGSPPKSTRIGTRPPNRVEKINS